MKKELKYFFYVVSILGYLIFIGSYYFSDKNIKNSYRSIKLYENKITNYNKNLITLESDTNEIIEYAENNLNQNKKKYNFWDLLFNDKK
tara:strand:+ start:121 stop:387 length:267 start_codon:yes stop_codon:yes gene_type:complete